MIRNHLKTGWRVISKDIPFTTINVIGLSTGLAIALLIILYGRFELSYEDANPLADRVARITMDYLDGQTVVDQDAETYPPLGPRVKNEFSDVLEYTRAQDLNESTLEVDHKTFRAEKIYAVDPAFFELMNYPLLSGQPKGLFEGPYQAVVSTDFAQKHFPGRNAIGETFQIHGYAQPFIIKGLISKSPANTHLKFNLLISYPTLTKGKDQDDKSWNSNNLFTYLLLNEGASIDHLNQNLSTLSERLMAEEKIIGERVIAQPIEDIHLHSKKSYEPEAGGDAESVYMLLGVALLVMLIAIVNYINLSTSKSLDRAREVGIRKVIGSSLSQLRLQFFTESMLINVFAGICAITWMALGISRFKTLADLPEDFEFFNEPFFWSALLGVLLISTILSGLFPALILSSFKPITVLRGKFSRAAYGVTLRKGLVIFQFAITTFLLVQTLTVTRQLDYMRSMDLGVNIDQTLVVHAPEQDSLVKNFPRFKEQLLDQTDIEAVALSTTVPGLPSHQMGSRTGVNLVNAIDNHNFNFYIYWIDADFVPTLQMKVLAGQNFQEGQSHTNQVIVNEESIRLWGIPDAESAIGQKIDLWGEARTIIAVVQNFNQISAKSAFIPLIFHYGPSWGSYASIRLKPGNLSGQIQLVEQIHRANFASNPFDFFFLDEEFDKQYRSDQQFQAVFKLLSGFALLIACLGLFGLVSFTIARRSKEIGIRKVLGANLSQVTTLLASDFVWLILISIAIALPITFFIIERWLVQYPFRIELNAALFLAPVMLLISIALGTILFKIVQFSLATPAASLRDE